MRHPGPWHCLAGCTLLFAAASHATVYEINSTTDPEVTVVAVDNVDESPAAQEWDKDTEWQVTSTPSDGFCSIREAIYASNYRIAVDGCEAGSGSDTLRLVAGKTYQLQHGSLPVGIGEKVVVTSEEVPDEDTENPDDTKTEYTVTFEPLSNQIALTLQLDAFEEAEDKVRPVISADNQYRVFTIHDRGAISLANLELRDGDATVPDLMDAEVAERELDSNGGLIRAAGTVIVNSNTVLAGGTADQGGAVYMTEGSGIAFRNGGLFEDNVAQQGAVIATSDTFDGNIIGYDFYMANNEATGGADAGVIYLDGGDPGAEAVPEDTSVVPPIPAVPAVPAVRIGLELGNGTITNNIGGAINVVSENYASVLVNMTIAFNDGVALTLAETVFDDPADAETTDHILHTVLVGNDGGACAGAGLDGTAVNAAAAARLLFTITDDSNCPLPEEQTLGTPVTSNPNGAQEDVFLGEGREPCEIGLKGAGVCLPMSADAIGGPYPAFLPNPLPDAVAADPLASPGFASLFDRGNPENSTVDPCESTDNRGNARGGAGGRCDVGAVEFLRAQAQPEEIDMISGQSVLGDVVANDLNDTVIDCRLLDDEIIGDGVCVLGDDACLDQARLDRCLTIIEFPELGAAVPVIDDNGYPKIRYTPSSNFHGVDQIRYKVDKDAFDGGTDLGQDQDEIANFFAEPASGLSESDSIGSLGGVMMAMLLCAGLMRRFGRGGRQLLAVAALLVSGQALAVDITVNSLEDRIPSIPNDGKCTLREALLNAGAAASTDCEYGGNSTDTILLPAGDIQLAGTLIIEGGGVEIIGKGARDEDTSDDDDTLTRILGDGSFRLFEVQPPGPNLGYPSVRFQYLTLEDGYAAGAGDAGSGAVVVTGGTVIFDRVRILNNEAEANGGVAFVRANAGNEKLLTFNRSFVSGNTAGVSGGVMASTAQNGETFRVAIVDSTFEGNTAAVEGGVLDANIRAGEVQISNSTFVNNSAPKGSALDFSGLDINANIMNSTFLNNTGGLGLELGDASTETRMGNSAYFNSGAACSSGATLLLDSAYNAYSGMACEATNASTTDQASTGAASLETSLSSVEGEGSSDDYVPPYLAIANAETDMVLVNMGNDQASLVSGTGTPLACRATDLRGVDRTSGGVCDVGAFEYQQITAEDDEGNNQNTPSRQVPVDILDNDLPSDGGEFVLLDEMDPGMFAQGYFTFEHAELYAGSDPEKYEGTGDTYLQDPDNNDDWTLFRLDIPSPATPSEVSMKGAELRFVWLYYNEERDGYDLKCGDPIPQQIIDDNSSLFEDGDIADECVVLFTPPAVPEFDDRMCASTSEDPVEVAFLYTFTDDQGATSTPATVVMTLKDKAPTLEGKSVVNQPGKKVVFKLEVSDPDEPDALIDWTSGRYDVSIANEPSFAKKNANGDVLGTGIVIDDDNAGTVTYVPDSNFNTFKDSFTLKVEDTLCDTTSQQVRYTVSYVNEETSAGSGSMGWMLLGTVMLLLRRRFAA